MKLKLFVSILLSTLLVSNIALALPGTPCAFYGTVLINGQLAPDGTTVTAKINGVDVGSTTTLNGKFMGSQILIVEDPINNRAGKIVQFFVNGVDTTQTFPFLNGGTVRLDFSITQATSTPTNPSSGGGTSSGGGSFTGTTGTTGTTTQQNQTTNECQEKWTCTDWSTCQEGVQTRTCTDANKCGTDLYKPFESQPCGVKEEAQEQTQTPTSLLPTGFFLGLSTMDWATGIIIGIVAALIVIFLIMRNKHSVRNKHRAPTKLMELKSLIETKTSETKPTG
jgi:hypothetical protein